VWLIGAMVCLLAAPWVQLSVNAGSGWPHNALRHHWLMPISCHFRDCKALLVTSLTHVSGAIASVQTFTLTFNYGSMLYHFREKARYWSKIAIFFVPTCIRHPRYGGPGPRQSIVIPFGTKKLEWEWCCYSTVEKV